MEVRAALAEKKLADLNAEALKKEAEAAVDEAVKNRKIAPASKAEYLSLCATKEGLENFKKIMAVSPEIISASPQAPEGSPPPGKSSVALNAEDIAFAKAMGYSEEEFKKIKEGGEK
jgi:phage I-like protein